MIQNKEIRFEKHQDFDEKSKIPKFDSKKKRKIQNFKMVISTISMRPKSQIANK